MTSQTEIPKGKLMLGASILIIGFLSPLLIPLVTIKVKLFRNKKTSSKS